MMKRKAKWTYVILYSLLVLVCFWSMSVGKFYISIPDIVKTLLGYGTRIQATVIYAIRLPRILVAAFVGMALSTSGCILQTVTRNELAEPGIIGINAGSALAVVLLIASGGAFYYEKVSSAAIFFMPFVSIVGALAAGLLIYGLAYKKKKVTPVRLILTGIGVNAGINAIITVYQLNMSKGDYNQALTWINGSLWGTNWSYVYFLAPLTLLFLFLSLYKSRILDVLALGDELAAGLGVCVERERRILLVYAVCLAAVATSVAGNISFLGLLGPHIAKKICGLVHSRQIPVAAGISAIIIVASDMASRNLFSPLELPVGIAISILGVPYFIYLIMRVKE
ncbi:FecCD family ABC transporter permease [[Clostridium] polysaccharolyticum]|uniref:Iron complex transport system permease protein n=1 Tax=[Clostridium] polysaccharolyticum TaxID=29364 RepID=A0A1H9Y3Z3_9FIRM|nr:iron ABC transporter permease [[Clostridium] polysaccharolyticum]SES63584.1 iron complex transport system permease protein [[Clostridium] polysaccharolyticum]